MTPRAPRRPLWIDDLANAAIGVTICLLIGVGALWEGHAQWPRDQHVIVGTLGAMLVVGVVGAWAADHDLHRR